MKGVRFFTHSGAHWLNRWAQQEGCLFRVHLVVISDYPVCQHYITMPSTYQLLPENTMVNGVHLSNDWNELYSHEWSLQNKAESMTKEWTWLITDCYHQGLNTIYNNCHYPLCHGECCFAVFFCIFCFFRLSFTFQFNSASSFIPLYPCLPQGPHLNFQIYLNLSRSNGDPGAKHIRRQSWLPTCIYLHIYYPP